MADITHNTLYDRDFYAWANEQARLIRAGLLSDLDLENLAEEVESMGRSEKKELVSRLTILIMHLLKWQFQPTGRGTSWRLTIEEQRRRLAKHLAANPSLKTELREAIESAHDVAVVGAARETMIELEIFPTVCPWTFDQIADSGFWPEAG